MSAKVSPELSTTNVVEYYLTEKAYEYDRSYYDGAGTISGEWFGKQCEGLGLTPGAPVDLEQARRLAYGQHPLTAEQLIEWRKPAEKAPCWVSHDIAWENHVKELVINAVVDGKDPLAAKQDSPQEAIQSIGHIVDPAPTCRTERETKLLEMHAIARQIYIENLQGEAGAGARAYLKTRGIKESTAEEFGVGLSDESGHQLVEKLKHYGPEFMDASGLFVKNRDGMFYDRFRDRLMFPIENEYGETIAFGARRPPTEKYTAKYVNTPETELYRKSEVLYNLNRAQEKMSTTGQAVMVEGYFDVLAAYQAGQTNVVAPCGTAFTEEQAGLIRQRADTVIVNFDEDDAGRHATEKAVLTATRTGLTARAMLLDQDPTDWLLKHKPKEYKEQVRAAAPLIDYLVSRAGEKYDLRDLYERVDATRWVQNAIITAPENLRERLSSELHTHLGIKQESAQKKEWLEHRSAWDLTFSAPKTYSLTATVGGDKRIVEAHNEAVKIALAYGERAIQVKMGGNHAPETTAKVVAALFRHDTARPVDGYAAPQLHTHCLIFNMSQDQADQFRALAVGEFLRVQRAMEAVYQAELSYRVKLLGYEIEYGPRYSTEIKGYSAEYQKAESPRRQDIQAAQERTGLYGPEAEKYITLGTREPKLKATPEEIRDSHQEHAEQYGNQPQMVVERARHHQNYILTPDERRQESDHACEYAKNRLSERTTVMEWFEIDRDALRLAKGNLRLEDIKTARDRAIEHGQFKTVGHWRQNAPESRYTTPELEAKEHKVLTWMQQGKDQVEPIAGGITRDEFREKFKTHLNDGQKWLVWNLIHSTDRMVGVQGIAGSGKTTALGVLKTFAEDYGYEVKGVAATGGASNEMKKAGIQSNTLAGLMLEKETAHDKPRLYLLDEASLADIHQMADFLDKVNQQDRVIVIGDVKQHGSVGAGRVFQELQEAGMQTFKLNKIVRQKPQEYQEIVRHLNKGEIRQALTKLDEWAQVHELEDPTLRQKGLALKFVRDPYATLGIAPDNRSCKELTEVIRKEMIKHGHLGDVPFHTRVLTSRSEMQKEDIKHAINYNPGDVLVYPMKTGPMARGDRGIVLAVDVDRNRITVMRESDGKTFQYDPRWTGTSISVYEAEEREFRRGDRVQFTRNDKQAGVTNRQLGTIEWLDTAGNAVIALDGDQKQRWIGSLRQMPHIDHGYCMTSFSSQGAKALKVVIYLDTEDAQMIRMLTQQLAYVAASRGIEEAHIYTDNIEKLIEILHRQQEQAPTALAPEVIAEYRDKQQEMNI
jgi:DNA primase catalytic core